MTSILLSPKTGKRPKFKKFFEIRKNNNFLVLANVTIKAHAEFQETSSIGNTRKNLGELRTICEASDDDYHISL